jgi:hypothetical protein
MPVRRSKTRIADSLGTTSKYRPFSDMAVDEIWKDRNLKVENINKNRIKFENEIGIKEKEY